MLPEDRASIDGTVGIRFTVKVLENLEEMEGLAFLRSAFGFWCAEDYHLVSVI
jgi:hypothetical protein